MVAAATRLSIIDQSPDLDNSVDSVSEDRVGEATLSLLSADASSVVQQSGNRRLAIHACPKPRFLNRGSNRVLTASVYFASILVKLLVMLDKSSRLRRREVENSAVICCDDLVSGITLEIETNLPVEISLVASSNGFNNFIEEVIISTSSGDRQRSLRFI